MSQPKKLQSVLDIVRMDMYMLGCYCTLCAPQYENEACLFGRWGSTGLTRPNWCDSRGKIKQPQEDFDPPPPGWAWDSDWTVSPELSIAFEPDEGLDEWTEDVFENQLRIPLSHWPAEKGSFWTDVVSYWLCGGSVLCSDPLSEAP